MQSKTFGTLLQHGVQVQLSRVLNSPTAGRCRRLRVKQASPESKGISCCRSAERWTGLQAHLLMTLAMSFVASRLPNWMVSGPR